LTDIRDVAAPDRSSSALGGGYGWLVARLAGVTVLILVCMFGPFLPGRYDPFAVALCGLAQIVGVSSALFVPLGLAWIFFGRRHGFAFAIAALAVASVVAAFASLAALFGIGLSLAAAWTALWLYAVSRTIGALKCSRQTSFSHAPLYLAIVPAVVALAQFMFLGRAVEMSRDLGMRKSAPMIDAIERYRSVYGRYPASLQALHSDYDPDVVGIDRYYYQPNGEGYDLYFEQLSNRLGTREIVMYNPRDEQLFPSHDSDILEWTPEQLRARRGYYAVHDATRPHWKYFWYD
jgi:hypothetical protein